MSPGKQESRSPLCLFLSPQRSPRCYRPDVRSVESTPGSFLPFHRADGGFSDHRSTPARFLTFSTAKVDGHHSREVAAVTGEEPACQRHREEEKSSWGEERRCRAKFTDRVRATNHLFETQAQLVVLFAAHQVHCKPRLFKLMPRPRPISSEPSHIAVRQTNPAGLIQLKF